MEVGICGKQTITVTEAMTAKAMGGGELPVYATPSMIALMDKHGIYQCCRRAGGRTGHGRNADECSKHLAASPVGMEVTCETKLIEVDRKRLVFEVRAFDKGGCIGEGIHERFIIANEKFLNKAQSKL